MLTSHMRSIAPHLHRYPALGKAHKAAPRILPTILAALVISVLFCPGIVASSAQAAGGARAADPVTCPEGQQPDPVTGVCVIVVTDPGGGGGGGDNGGGGDDPGGGGTGNASGPKKCTFGPKTFSCTGKQGTWSAAKMCFVSPAPGADIYAPGDPIWEGHYPEGGIYLCFNPWLIGVTSYDFWAPGPPEGAAPPDPEDLAQEAMKKMNLTAITIGIVPEPGPDSAGVIGLPTWMWAANPAVNTIGPITRTASAGGYTVTATGKVTKMVWDMGDGTQVQCHAPGTPYTDAAGASSSPDCGHTYTRDGQYDINVTTYWTIEWEGIGQTGEIPQTRERVATITMGEGQVPVQGNK